MANNGTTNTSNAADVDTITSNAMPRNCPMVTSRARRLADEKSNININVSSILDATKAPVPIPRSVQGSVILDQNKYWMPYICQFGCYDLSKSIPQGV